MCKFYLLIFFIIGANCDCISPVVKKEIRETYALAQSNHDFLLSLLNLTTDIKTSAKTNCFLVDKNKMFDLDEMQKNLTERTEQILDQKFASISEEFNNSALNMNKLQTSVDELRDSVTANKKYMNEEHKETSFILKTFGQQLDAIQNILLQMEAQNSTLQKKTLNLADDCLDLYNKGFNVSKSYLLPKYNREVKCDMETDGGGWLVIQQRRKVTNQVDFNRDWASYKEGFGDSDTEFWIGNEFLHRITNQKSYELRIDMEDFELGPFYATYSEFLVEHEAFGYKLHVGEYEGNLRDSLSIHKDKKFSTFDRDNEEDSRTNCAKDYFGGFWYIDKFCYRAHLNGMFPTVPDRKNDKLITWWDDREFLVPIKVEMKIRPKQEIVV